jgi:hypothetical protein
MAHKQPKKPKKPKLSSSVSVWERFDQRMKDWHKKVADIKNAKRKKETLVKKYQ